MKKFTLTVLACLLAVPTFAGTHNKRHSLEIAYEHSSYKYTEPGLMKLSGHKNGVSASYMMRSILSTDFNDDDRSFAMLNFRYMTGDTDYDGGIQYWDGSSWQVTPYSVDGLDDYYFEADMKLGQTYQLGSPLTLYPYFGVGWRQLRNHLDQAGPGGYQRTQTYVYIPLGAHLEWDMTQQFTLTFKGEFDWMVYGNNNSGDDLSFKQSQGYGLRVSAKGQINLDKIGVFMEPFYRYWHIQNSTVEYGYVEPKNNTKEYGLRLGIAF